MSLLFLKGDVTSKSIMTSKFILKFFSETYKACLIASILEDLSFESFSGLFIQRSTLFLVRFKIFLEFVLITILEIGFIFFA